MCLNLVLGKKAVVHPLPNVPKDLVKVSYVSRCLRRYGQLGPRGVVRILVPVM